MSILVKTRTSPSRRSSGSKTNGHFHYNKQRDPPFLRAQINEYVALHTLQKSGLADGFSTSKTHKHAPPEPGYTGIEGGDRDLQKDYFEAVKREEGSPDACLPS